MAKKLLRKTGKKYFREKERPENVLLKSDI